MLFLRIRKLSRIILNGSLVSALTKGTAAAVEHSVILKNLDCNYVVDVGANRGQFALAARHCFPRAQIISFEPLKEPADLFRRVFQFDPKVLLHECAIGEREAEVSIHVSQADDSSSLLPISELQQKLFPGTSERETRQIQVKPLDSVLQATDIKEPALLKIDVQGFELQALKGCLSLLHLFSYVYVECSFVELYSGQALAHEVVSFMSEYSFILSGVYNLFYDKQGQAIQGDFLFEKKASP